MNWNKVPTLAGSMFFCIAGIFASNNEKGIEYFRAELYDAAKIYFKNQIAQNQGIALAENYYYLGESFIAAEQLDSAAYYFQKAIQTDSEYPYSYIGEGKLALRNNNAKLADDLFKKALNLAKKDPAVPVSVAGAYIEINQYAKVEEFLDRAKKIKKNFSGIYVAEGDMLMSQEKIGDASGRYDMAIRFNADDKVAYLKKIRVYKTINTDAALELLTQLLAIDPEYIPAYAELGDTHYRRKNYTKAIEAYQKFIGIPGVPVLQLFNYASSLYFIKEYEKSLAEIHKVLANDPENLVMCRLQFYNNYELKKNALGLEQAEKFIQTRSHNDLIAQDYAYYGRLLEQANDIQGAIEAFKKALTIDEHTTDVLKDLAAAYEKEEDWPNAIIFHQKFINNDRNATQMDVLNFGRLLYRAGNQEATTLEDSVIFRDYLVRADSVFTQIVEWLPDNYIGYFWRSRANVGLDPETTLGLAKPLYEQAMAILEASPAGAARNRDLIECYRYLGYYYYLQNNIPTAREFFQKILELDPENEAAKQFLDAIKR